MKILAIHNAYDSDQSKRSAVDQWRIARPLAELKKHVVWQIDERESLLPNLGKYKTAAEFTQEEMERAFASIAEYDIVISSYHANPTMYTLLKVAADKTGLQYIMDVDDDVFAINPDNPVWAKIDDEKAYWMQCMVRDNAWISSTTPELARVFRERRRQYPPESVFINPNFITDAYQHPKLDNKGKIVIGFFGGSSHYADIHNTGALEAIQKIMHEHKNVYFKSVGMVVDTYLPKARVEIVDGKRGDVWLKEIYPKLNMDIAIGPLEDNIFNNGKSNIKWQESTRAGAAFVASRIGPYSTLSYKVARTVRNSSEDWYEALESLVTNEDYRHELVEAAQSELQANYRLEDKWIQYRDMFQLVYDAKQVGTSAPVLEVAA